MERKADKSKGGGTSPGARSRFLPSVPDLDYTLKIVRNWIKECESHHEVCAVAADPQLPTRILDLGSTHSSKVKLLTFTSSLRGPYICLSYCWGKSQNLPSHEPLQTDESNCSTWTEGIPWSLFPRTFQDAITLTRGLGLRYLWIDALCIMQGNSADWIRESASMASIYSNSYLTIAATAGPNPEHGLFFPRWTQWAAGHRQAIEAVELTGLHLGHHRFVYAHKAMEHIEDAPLLTRAWTFQERLLPARTLHFHAEELIWECKSGMDCECSELKKVGWTVPSSDVTSGWMKVSMFSPQETSLEARSYKWLVAVSEFSKLHISAESDRVPALSGLSEIFSRFPGNVLGAYFGGIWRNDLARGLLYQRCEQMDGERLSPSDLKAFDHILPPPSWSWTRLFFNRRNELSYNIVLYCGFQEDRYFSIQTVQCSSLNANSFGWATNGRLEVSGRCVEVCLQAPCVVPVGQLEVEITLSKKVKTKLGLSDVDNATFVNDGQAVIDEQSRLLCLLVGSSREETPEWRYALILKQSTCTLEFHERVGILYIDKSNGWFPEGPESVEVVNIIIV